MAAGADVVLYSGISEKSLAEAIERTLESRRQLHQIDRFDRKGSSRPRIDDFISDSGKMQMFMDEVHQIIPSSSVLLITGETGVGKEHLAKAIHAESPRSAGPFIAVNTAALPEQLLESELFGHEQGAFTGAVRSRRGAFELAHGGTIFLDEIGEMPLHLQTKLLRVLQDYEVQPVGSEAPIWVDVRIIAASNRNLEEEVAAGNFPQGSLLSAQRGDAHHSPIAPPQRRYSGSGRVLCEFLPAEDRSGTSPGFRTPPCRRFAATTGPATFAN